MSWTLFFQLIGLGVFVLFSILLIVFAWGEVKGKNK